MKKFNIILMLLLMFFVTGCGNKKFDLYQGSQDIKITRKSDSGTARINFSDTYKKGGEKYFIFTKCCRKAPCFSNGDIRQLLFC